MLTADDLFPLANTLSGTVLIIGEPDTGKSFLARELYRIAKMSGRYVSLLDLDVGQQSLAYPGTVALLKDEEPFDRMRFVGTINPFRRMDHLLSGAKSLLSLCTGCPLVIVDTSGLVAGNQGRILKTKKIRELKPDLLVAIQRKDELEHILREVPEFEVIRVHPSSSTLVKCRETRIRNRNERLLTYFSQPSNFFYLKRNSVKLTPQGAIERCPPGRIIGLSRNGDTLALGIFEGIDKDNIFFSSPISFDKIREIDEIIVGEPGLEVPFRSC